MGRAPPAENHCSDQNRRNAENDDRRHGASKAHIGDSNDNNSKNDSSNNNDYTTTTDRPDAATLGLIPSHPLGVKPLGNQYLSSAPSARRAIGALGSVPDEVLMILLEHLDGATLTRLGACCRFLYAFCRADELWRTLSLQ